MPEASSGPVRSGGRPRDDSRDGAIRRATLQLLAELGYDGVTMDRVATRARAGKATIYRRWPSKVALIMDAISTVADDTLPIADTGSFREDMLSYLSSFTTYVVDDRGKILAELVSEMSRNEELRSALRDGLLAQRKSVIEAIVTRGVARGEVSASVDHHLLSELGSAILLQRLLLFGEAVSEEFIVSIVDGLIVPFATGIPTSSTPAAQPSRTPEKREPIDA